MRRWSYGPIDLLLPACVAWLLAPSAAYTQQSERPVPSRGQPLDHVVFAVTGLDAWYDRLRAAGVQVLEPPHSLGAGRAFMFQDPDRLAVELVEGV